MTLSDRHNFGGQVRPIGCDWIEKPRTMFWENLMLSDSPFRQGLAETTCATPVRFSLPTLDFKCLMENNGFVKRLIVEPMNSVSPAQAFSAGCTIGLFAWMGMSDLHDENIFTGMCRRDGFIFTTVDIETVFDDLATLGHSGLISDRWVPVSDAGISKLLKVAAKSSLSDQVPAALCHGYLSTFRLLESKSDFLLKLLRQAIGDKEVPIRVVIRKTKSYSQYMRGEPAVNAAESPMMPSEITQMSRGDIPYFFRVPDCPDKIFEYTDGMLLKEADLGAEFKKIPLLKRRRFSGKMFEPAKNFGSLLKVGLLQLARDSFRALRSEDNTSRYEGTNVTLNNRRIFITSEHHPDLKIAT